ncbi:hypothetical protein LguiA_016013 [Lonicera macranthoides]
MAAATASFFTLSKLPSSSKLSSFSSFSHLKPFKLCPHPKTLKLSSTTKISATISVGDTLPDTVLTVAHLDDDIETISVSSITKNKKTVLFAVPGAYTPTCTLKHLPGFVEKAAELKSKGVDVIACISLNDAYVMRAWKFDLKINDDVLMLSDCGDFTKGIGCELDLSDKPEGFGVRSRRYSMLVEDGVVKVLNLEEGGAFTSSGAEDILKVL